MSRDDMEPPQSARSVAPSGTGSVSDCSKALPELPSPITVPSPTHSSISLEKRHLYNAVGDLLYPMNIRPSEPKKAWTPPNGGYVAWLQVAVAFLIVFNGFGLTLSFGVFQSLYSGDMQLEVGPPVDLRMSNQKISLIGAFQLCLLFLLSCFSCRLLRLGLFYLVVPLGSGIQLAGIIGTSFATKYWHFLLAQGLAQGVGNGLLFIPVVWLISTYFTTRQSLALTIASTGAPVGGALFTTVAQQLLPQVGFAWTVRGFAIIVGANTMLILTAVRPKKSRQEMAPMKWGALLNVPYFFFCSGLYLCLTGLFVVYFYLPTYCLRDLGLSSSTSLSLLIALNVAAFVGRVVPPLLADYVFGTIISLVFFAAVSGFCMAAWSSVTSLTGIVCLVIAYGFSASAVQALFAAGLAALTPDLGDFNIRAGKVYSTTGFACLTGPVIAGHLIDQRDGSFSGLQMFTAMVMLAGAILIALSGLLRARVIDMERNPRPPPPQAPPSNAGRRPTIMRIARKPVQSGKTVQPNSPV